MLLPIEKVGRLFLTHLDLGFLNLSSPPPEHGPMGTTEHGIHFAEGRVDGIGVGIGMDDFFFTAKWGLPSLVCTSADA